jgi:hypothetical protein
MVHRRVELPGGAWPGAGIVAVVAAVRVAVLE